MNCTEVPVIKTSSEQVWLTLICNNKHGGFQNRCGLFMCCFFGVFSPLAFSILALLRRTCFFTNLASALQLAGRMACSAARVMFV